MVRDVRTHARYRPDILPILVEAALQLRQCLGVEVEVSDRQPTFLRHEPASIAPAGKLGQEVEGEATRCSRRALYRL
jgi:hypothetical protein